MKKMYKIILSIIYIVSFGILFNCSNYLIRYGRTRREIKWFVASLGCVQLWFVSQILIFIATDEIQLKIAYLIGNFGICLIGSSWIKFIFVFDNGKGCDKLVIGRGLGGIIERTEEVGGNIKFNTREGEGFQTIIQLPIKNKNEIYSFK